MTGDIDRGRLAFENRGCLACHAVEPNAAVPDPKNRPLFSLGSVSTGCLAGDGVRRGAAPQFPFDEAQRVALAAFLQTDGASADLRCACGSSAACHVAIALHELPSTRWRVSDLAGRAGGGRGAGPSAGVPATAHLVGRETARAVAAGNAVGQTPVPHTPLEKSPHGCVPGLRPVSCRRGWRPSMPCLFHATRSRRSILP